MNAAVTTSKLEVRRAEIVALSNLDLTVPQGSSLAVIGPNGSGKSTLLETIAGILRPHSGTITLAAEKPALVPQTTHIDPSLPITVRETVEMARYATLGILRRFRAADHRAVDEAMERLEIDHLADRQVHELSGGQRQRALVAQGLAQDASMILLDEPLIGLDLASRQVILDVMDEQVAGGRTVVVTTHDLDDARRCDQVLLLDSIPIAVGTPNEVLTVEHLRHAFGGRVAQVGDELILDDPHHSH